MSEPRDDGELAELIARSRAGDRDALGQLLGAFRDDLRAAAVRLLDGRVAGRVDASDMVQMTCLSVYRKFDDFVGNEAAQFAAWLRQIHERNIQNAVRDHLHVEKRAATDEEPLGGRDVREHRGDTASRLVMRKETTEQLAAALDQLPAEESIVLRRRYLDGLTLAELCDELNLSREAVIWRIQKAMRRLRSQLRDEDL